MGAWRPPLGPHKENGRFVPPQSLPVDSARRANGRTWGYLQACGGRCCAGCRVYGRSVSAVASAQLMPGEEAHPSRLSLINPISSTVDRRRSSTAGVLSDSDQNWL